MTFGRIAILAAALAVALPGAALAQAPVYNWSGTYIGAFGGYGWNNTTSGPTSLYDPPEDPPFILDAFSYPGSGFLGGAEFGHNWQNGNVVFGVVGDIAAANIRGTVTNTDFAFATDSTINWLSTARLNVGVPIAANLLIYGTGGLAVGGVTSNLNDYYDSGTTVITSSTTTTNVGWTIGAGVAAALPNNWIAKAEYLYVDLGSKAFAFSQPDPGYPLITGSTKTTANLLKFSVGFKY